MNSFYRSIIVFCCISYTSVKKNSLVAGEFLTGQVDSVLRSIERKNLFHFQITVKVVVEPKLGDIHQANK